MKKILALTLALCMALAMLPALAETATAQELSGTWYMNMMGITAMTFDLNEDGSAVITSVAEGDGETLEGTWTLEGNTVTITVEGEGLVLTYDGTNMVMDEATMAEMGVDDESMSAFLVISREPGISIDELMASSGDSAGDTGDTNVSDPIGADPAAQEAAEVTVLSENCYVYNSWGGSRGIYLAKIQNNTAGAFYLNGGLFTLKDADGNTVGEYEYPYAYGSRYLAPGEITFISFEADVNEGATVANYSVSFETTTEYIEWYEDYAFAVDAASLSVDYQYENYVNATLTNTGSEPQANISVIIAAEDAEGRIWALAEESLYRTQLCPNSSVIVWESINSSIIEYCVANNIELTQAEAIGWISR